MKPSLESLRTAAWWQILTNYNPPHRKLSLRHLAIVGDARTLCGVVLPASLLEEYGVEFGGGASDCKRCKAASR